MRVSELLDLCANDNYEEIDFYDEVNQINDTTTARNIDNGTAEYNWADATVEYWYANFDAGVLQIKATLPYIKSSRRNSPMKRLIRASAVMASAWVAPNGKRYGKQTRRFPGKYLFTKKELRDMVDSGIAEDMAGTFDPLSMNYDIIGIAWNETNGHRSGILIEDLDTGSLYVGNAYDGMVAKY